MKSFVLGSALVLLALLCLFPLSTEGQAQPGQPALRATTTGTGGRPSLLLITLDTTRWDHLQPYGAENVETPVLAALAREGVVFEQAFAVAPITLPAHTTIHTGLYPPQTGVRNNGIHYVPAEVTTLAERLRARGWRTAAFVSAAVLERRYGLDQGFEVYDDDLSTGRERRPRMVPDRPAEATVTAASRWLDTLPPDDPFFLWVHFYDPHAAYSPPPPYRDQYRGRLYDGEIAYMDAQIGRLLAHSRLSTHPQLVVMTLADHGESLGEHGEQTHAILAYDSTLHIPWIAKLPGAKGGTRVAETVSQIDLVPTLIELCDLEADTSLPGRSLVPLLGDAPRALRRAVYGETYLPFYTYGWAKLRVLRRDRWKLIDAPEPELYDLRRDPRELSNQFEREPGAAHDMRRELDQFLTSMGSPEREVALELDTATAERLRSLGYLAVGSGEVRHESKRPDPKKLIGLHVALERARIHLQDRLYDQAEKQLRSVLRKDPKNLAALIDLVAALEAQGSIDEAVQTVRTALTLDPSYARLHLLYAGLQLRRNRPEESLALIDAALNLDPRYLEARIRKAYVLEQLGREDEVEEVLEAALREGADDPPVNAAYAQLVELRRGDLEAAEQRLRKAVARDPFLVSAWQLLGITLARSGRTTEAVSAYREALRRVPDSEDAHAQLGILLARQGAGAEAESHLREAIRLGPQFRSEVHVALGAWLAEHGRLEEAEQEYAKVLEREPKNAAARNNRAVALYRIGRLSEAEKELQALIREQPDNADAHNNLAAIALQRKDWKRAEGEARAALAANPALVAAWSNLGIALDEQGSYADAERAFHRALEQDPTYWQARNNLATTFRKTGRSKEAAGLFEEVLEQVPTDPEVHLELGDLYFGPLGEPERARAHYNAVLRHAPEHPRAGDIRERLAGRAGSNTTPTGGPSATDTE
jgi:arylsulfatase A-like enzyme/Flp pilus assembly protein TadD